MITALFERPDWLPVLMLAPLVWLGLHLCARARVRKSRAWLGDRAAWLSQDRAERRVLRRSLFVLAVLLLLVAALGPSFGERDDASAWRGVDVVVCLDVSRSMLARDLRPHRLAHAKAQIDALAKRVSGDRLGLVLFAGEARLVAPLTEDAASFAGLAEQAEPASVLRGGTDVAAALDTALLVLEASRGEQSAVLLLTDGEDLSGRSHTAADRCRERGVAVHCVGLGSERGSKIALPTRDGEAFLRDRGGRDVVSAMNASSLEQIAETTGGAFVVADETDALVDVYERRILPMARVAYASSERGQRKNRFQWPLAAALFLFVLQLAWAGRPRRRRRGAMPAFAATRWLVLFAVLVAGCGGDAARPHYDSAIAALQRGELDAAIASAATAAERGGHDYEALRDFLRGNVAFERSVAAEAAMREDADPRARQAPIAHTEDALAAWRAAASTRTDWPAARRNVERALIRLEMLRERRSEGSKGDPQPGDTPPDDPPDADPPKPPENDGDGNDPEPPPSDVASDALPAAKVLGLLELLVQKERQKLALRRAQRSARSAEVEKDW